MYSKTHFYFAILSLSFFAVLVFNSCKKEEVKQETYSSLDHFLQSVAPQADEFTLDAEGGGVLTTKYGTVITFPPNALINGNGQLVTGSVTVRMKELYSNAEICFAGINTTRGSSVLDSDGEFFLEATQNGQQLQVADGQSVTVEIFNDAVNEDMRLFVGPPEESPDTLVIWRNPPADSTGIPSSYSFEIGSASYTIELEELSFWLNIDIILYEHDPIEFDISIENASGLNEENTTAVVFFAGHDVVIPIKQYFGSIGDNNIHVDLGFETPQGIVVISEIDNVIHFGLAETTPTAGATVPVTLTPGSAADIEQALNSLP